MSTERKEGWLKEAQQRMKKNRHCAILAAGEDSGSGNHLSLTQNLQEPQPFQKPLCCVLATLSPAQGQPPLPTSDRQLSGCLAK